MSDIVTFDAQGDVDAARPTGEEIEPHTIVVWFGAPGKPTNLEPQDFWQSEDSGEVNVGGKVQKNWDKGNRYVGDAYLTSSSGAVTTAVDRLHLSPLTTLGDLTISQIGFFELYDTAEETLIKVGIYEQTEAGTELTKLGEWEVLPSDGYHQWTTINPAMDLPGGIYYLAVAHNDPDLRMSSYSHVGNAHPLMPTSPSGRWSACYIDKPEDWYTVGFPQVIPWSSIQMSSSQNNPFPKVRT